MNIYFKIKNQQIERLDNNKLVEKSREYVNAFFIFSEDWQNHKKTITFTSKENDTSYNVELVEDNCLVPWEVITPAGFTISGFGEGESFITLNKIEIEVEKSGLTEDGEVPGTPTPTQWELYKKEIKEIIDSIPETEVGNDTVTTHTEYATGFGYKTTAGQKGFKILEANKAGSYFILDSVEGIELDDIYSVQGDAYGDKIGKVVAIDVENRKVTVDNFFETSYNNIGYSWKDIFFIDTKPNIGTIENAGYGATAEGYSSMALKLGSHAEGSSVAFGPFSHAENKGEAKGYGSHAEGYSVANDYYSHAEGERGNANGRSAHAEGNQTNAVGRATHAEGELTEALASRAHAEGFRSKAKEEAAHAEGKETEARGQNSHAEGSSTIAEQSSSHAEGANTRALKQAAHAEGLNSEATGAAAHAEGYMTKASGNYSHSEGKYYEKNSVITQVEASGEAAHAEGLGTLAGAAGAHAEGELSKATGYASHAEGHSTATSSFSHAEGTAKATKSYAHAEGAGTQANANYSHSEGWGTIASGEAQHVQGKYNLEDTTSAFIIGNGTSSKRSNAMAVDWNGNAKFSGTVTDGSGNVLGNSLPLDWYEVTIPYGWNSSTGALPDGSIGVFYHTSVTLSVKNEIENYYPIAIFKKLKNVSADLREIKVEILNIDGKSVKLYFSTPTGSSSLINVVRDNNITVKIGLMRA